MDINEYREMHGNDEYDDDIKTCSECGIDYGRLYFIDGAYYCAGCLGDKCWVGHADELEQETLCSVCGEPITDGDVYCLDEVPSDDNLMCEECFWSTVNEKYLMS